MTVESAQDASLAAAIDALSIAVVVMDESLEVLDANRRYRELVEARFGPERGSDVPLVEVAAVVFGIRPFDLIDAVKVLRTGGRTEIRIASTRPSTPTEPAVDLRITRLGVDKRYALAIERRAARETDTMLIERLASHLPDAIVVTDARGLIRLWNESAERLFGVAKSAALGRAVDTIVPDLDPARLRSVLDRDGKFQGRCGLHTDEGQPPCLFAWSAGTGDDSAVLFVHRDSDPTRRAAFDAAHAHEVMRRSQRLEAIGALAGGVAHDFNNLLSVVQSYANFVYQDLPESSALRADVQEILGATHRGAQLTRQLLAFGRKQVFDPKLSDLDEVVETMERLLGRLIGENVSILVERTEDTKPILVDTTQLEQVVVNLALNARDAMPEGGMLSLRTCIVTVGPHDALRLQDAEPGRYAELAVLDTGIGMDEEVRTRLFEPFFTTKGPTKGTGLGLSTAYGIVRQSGGHIVVESKPGLGSTFRVRLPLKHGDTMSLRPSRPTPLASADRPALILVVEDEPKVREIVRRVLGSRGFVVHACGDANEALSFLTDFQGRVDLLLTDLVLPGMSGAALAERVITLRPNVCVIYMTGYVDAAAESLGVTTRGRDVLHKPFSPATLVSRVRAAIEKRREEPRTTDV